MKTEADVATTSRCGWKSIASMFERVGRVEDCNVEKGKEGGGKEKGGKTNLKTMAWQQCSPRWLGIDATDEATLGRKEKPNVGGT